MENDDIRAEQAMYIVTNEIAKIMDSYAIEKDKEKSQKSKEKIDLLQKIKDEIYIGNKNIIDRVLEKHKEGIL